jgi:hypothetical protein
MNIKNKKFGLLTVISFSHKEEKQCPNSIGRKYYWNCLCDCGNKTKVEQSQLIIGRIKNCGNILNHGMWNKEQEEKLKLLYPKGSWESILKAIPNKSKHAIGTYANNRGIKRKLDFGDTIRKGTLKPLLEENNIAYYWIGFIIADGWINHKTGQLVIMIADKDIEHLKKFAALTKSKVKFPYGVNTKINSGYHKNGTMVRVSIQDPATFDIIKKFKFCNNKTSNPPTMDFDSMSDNFFMSLFCGYIDGDGSIFKAKNKTVRIIKIQCHAAYLVFLKNMEKKLHKILNLQLEKSLVYIDNKGYAYWNMSRKNLIDKINSVVNTLHIPIMHRKWININN